MSKFITLSNGVKMPTVGLGTWQAGPGEVENALRIALDNGYRQIDTAAAYQNEEEIGKVLNEYISSGKIKREELFIVTKLFWIFSRAEDVEPQIKQQLAKLQLDYLDLYLLHTPIALDHTHSALDNSVVLTDTWKAMEKVYEKKLTRAIGVSNFNADQIERIQKIAMVPIHNNQLEVHLYFNQKELQAVCKKHNISVTAYAPLGSPGRTNLPLPNGFKATFGAAPNPLENASVVRLAKKYNKTPGQILLRHLVQRDIAVIPKSTNEKRLKENFDIYDFNFTKDEMDELNNAPQRPRLFNLEFMAGHVEDPFADERPALKK
uniref:NADP-dependent oxidoreductase domain-containing protein n=1 Tax=Ditylenchus dipsaci TaxID=166011 RepID=A0A915E5N8_9BILA